MEIAPEYVPSFMQDGEWSNPRTELFGRDLMRSLLESEAELFRIPRQPDYREIKFTILYLTNHPEFCEHLSYLFQNLTLQVCPGGIQTHFTTHMRHMFYCCEAQEICLGKYDTSNLEDTEGMFSYFHC